jgi:glycosyltransferase involved in cell wall biosynthesis
MPTYNGEAFLRASLESLAAQAPASIECIVVDDASTDRTSSILAEFQNRLRLTIKRNPVRGSWTRSTNEALRAARGEYVAFLHQDDVWLPGRLAALQEMMSRAPNASLLLGSAHFLDSAGRRIGRWRCPLPSGPPEVDKQLLLARLLVQNFVPLPAAAIKRELALEVGGLDESLWYTADWDFWLKLAPLATTIYDDRPSVGFRVHSGSQTFLRSADLEDIRAQLTAVPRRHLAAWKGSDQQKMRLGRISDFSVEMNVALAGAAHGRRANLLRMLARFLALGFRGQYTYIRDSRILERAFARIRAGAW